MNLPKQPLTVAVNTAWEPGDGTRYDLMLVEHPTRIGKFVLSWLNATGGGRCMTLPTIAHVDGSGNKAAEIPISDVFYMAEKLRCTDTEARSIGAWLVTQGISVDGL